MNTLAVVVSEDILGQIPDQFPSAVLHASASKEMVLPIVTGITSSSGQKNSSGDQQNEAFNLDVPTILTPADFPPLINTLAPISAAGEKLSKIPPCPPLEQDLQDSPSRGFNSKLAARVKSIDGNIPLVRQA